MQWAIMMALQVAGPPVPIELRSVKPASDQTPCGEADDQGDIVVCGRVRDADRLKPVDPARYAERPIRTATTLGKVNIIAEAEQGALPNGQTSPRAMLRLKLPF